VSGADGRPGDPRVARVALRTGLTYNVLEWGAEHAASDHTVLLVHGFLDFAWGWDDVAQRLAAAGLHVIAPDMRGHGDSDRVGRGGYYHFMDYVADLAEVVRLTARPRLSLCGHSMGGGIAAYYAGVFPERVQRLALLEGVNAPEHPMEPVRAAAWVDAWTRIASSPAKPGHASIDVCAERLRKNDPRLTPELARWLAERGTRQREDGSFEFKHDPLHLTVGPYGFAVDVAARFWRRVACPTLLVEGEDSMFRLHGDEAERRYGAFAHARREVLPGAAHMMQRHQPAALAQLLVDFFR
jgi:pimeloyl-ACP methyl ester carboxylesterase